MSLASVQNEDKLLVPHIHTNSEGRGGEDGECIFDICVVDQDIRIRCWYVMYVLFYYICTYRHKLWLYMMMLSNTVIVILRNICNTTRLHCTVPV